MKIHHKLLVLFLSLAFAFGVMAYLILPEFWEHHEHNPKMKNSPRVTRTADDIPGDPINVAFFATESELLSAFESAGFNKAGELGLKNDLTIAESVVFNRPDQSAPVSNLFLWGRKQDHAFEQEVGKSADHRHHVRLWRSNEVNDKGQPLWVGSNHNVVSGEWRRPHMEWSQWWR